MSNSGKIIRVNPGNIGCGTAIFFAFLAYLIGYNSGEHDGYKKGYNESRKGLQNQPTITQPTERSPDSGYWVHGLSDREPECGFDTPKQWVEVVDGPSEPSWWSPTEQWHDRQI